MRNVLLPKSGMTFIAKAFLIQSLRYVLPEIDNQGEDYLSAKVSDSNSIHSKCVQFVMWRGYIDLVLDKGV